LVEGKDISLMKNRWDDDTFGELLAQTALYMIALIFVVMIIVVTTVVVLRWMNVPFIQ